LISGPEGLTIAEKVGSGAVTPTSLGAGVSTPDSKTGTPAPAVLAAQTPGSTAYKIGPLDVLEISVFKVAELSKTVQVADTGTVNLPLVGEVQAAGRTPQDLERELTKSLGAKYLQKPQVTVFVKEYNSQRVTVEGAVKKPGVYPLQGKNSLLQMIATAQGLETVSDSTIVIFRTTNGKRAAARFDLAEIRAGNTDDPNIQPGDVIVAGTSAIKETFTNFIRYLPVASIFTLL